MAHERVINSNRKEITRIMDLKTSTVLEGLVDKGVISYGKHEQIKYHQERVRQSSALLDELCRVSPEQFSQFLQVLRENEHGNLAAIIEGMMNMDPYMIKKPRIVLLTKNGNMDDPGLNATLESMRDALLYIDRDVVDLKIHDTDRENLDLDTVTFIINSLPDPVVFPRQTLRSGPKTIPMSYIVTDTIKGCVTKETSQDEIETLRQYKSRFMSPPNIVFFLGSAVKRDWDQRLGHGSESFQYNYIPVPMSLDVARLTSRDQDSTKMQVLFDITSVQLGPKVLLTLEKAATDIRTELRLAVVVLVSNDIDDAVKNRLQNMVTVMEISSKEELISKFKENTIWVYIEDEGPLTWTRMQPVLYGMPQILPIRSTILDILDDRKLKKNMTWSETKPIKDKVIVVLMYLREAYKQAHKLTCEFLCSEMAMKSREKFFKACFSNNLAILKAGIFKKMIDLGGRVRYYWKTLDRVVYILGAPLRYVGLTKGDHTNEENSINLKILEYLNEHLPENTAQVTVSQGSICQLLYVRDEQALWDIQNMVSEGKASKAMLQVLILTNVFKDGSLKNCGIQMDLYLRNDNKAIACHRMMMEDMEMSKPLREAIVEGNREMVSRILASGMNTDEIGKDGKTTLHVACENGQVEICRLLLKYKAEVNKKNKQGKTPLHLACVNGPAVICTMLLAHGAIVNSTDKDGNTALHVSAENCQADMCRILLKGKADVNVKDLQGKTPLHLACANGPTVVCRMFLDSGAIVNSTDKNNRTPLHYSAEYGHALVSKLLLEKGASLDMEDKNGATPCDLARSSLDPNTRRLFSKEKQNKEEAMILLQEAMQEGADLVEVYNTIMPEWLEARSDVLCKLEQIANEIDKYNEKANKATAASAGISLMGAVGSVFFPPLAIPAVLGGVAAMTSKGLDINHRKRKAKEAEKDMKRDQALSKDLENTLKKIGNIADKYVSRIPHMTREQIIVVIMLGERAIGSHAVVIHTFGILISTGFLSAAAFIGWSVGATVPVVAIPVAFFTLITSLGQLTGNLDAASKELRDVITDLKKGYNEMKDMFKELKGMKQSLNATSSLMASF